MSSLVVTIEFKSKASYNRFKRNFNAGKGTNLSQKDIDIVSEVEGAGLISGLKSGLVGLSRNQAIKNAANKIGKDLINKGVNKLAQNEQYGMLAPIAGQLAQQQLNSMTGQGLISDALGKVKQVAKSKQGRKLIQQIGNKAIKEGMNRLKDSEYGMLAPVAGQLAQQQLDNFTQGEGFMDFVKKAGNVIKKVPIKNIAKVVTPLVAESVANTAMMSGNPVTGMIARQAIMNAGNQISGGSIGRGRFVKGSAEAKAHMAQLRARRTGGSLRR